VETLAFYSYKGGVGRSLLLANAARFLVSLGKGVVALDLDFEAPGLHYMLVSEANRASVSEKMGGAVPYLLATAQGATAPPPLEDHMFDIPVPPESQGWLRLMPAGPAPDRKYWTALKQLGEQIRFDDPSGQGLLTLLDLHARIEDELKPDYLLIDVRPGVTELGGLATTILADSVVCAFVASQESLDGTLTVVEALKAAPRLDGQYPVRIVPVLVQTTSEPLGEDPFGAGVKRLLDLGEWGEAGGKERKPLVFFPEYLQHAVDFGAMTDSVHLLFQKLFL
jgi:cellulose biosynthesis protein BcsQ